MLAKKRGSESKETQRGRQGIVREHPQTITWAGRRRRRILQ